ncbi:Mannosylfructose-phosphate synthase [Candidatus Izimaplasma bacterium HR1]|jgi:sucrose-phosphate synthase|uniref:glycosyltransferase n=1 Tax=Candidatus Izimoplasma sp. HR1 TaxID=1541959 RepID=UPI0004F6D2A0|nr:Mannosylfructose-phosphate synthase [Candidatus Izimaplasma bacterium HR1]
MNIIFLNPQGNFDNADSFWTMHPDFGGQLVYVKEIAIEMAKLGHSIDIVTRQVVDEQYPMFKTQIDHYENVENLRIIRIQCGGNKFLNKELLWEHLNEWTNNIIDFYEKENTKIDFMTGHYGDGGLACAMMKDKKGIPYSFTGHSLGAQKFDKLNDDFKNYDELIKKYSFNKRIIAERTAISNSDMIFVSTSQERDEQYRHVLYFDTFHRKNPPNFTIAPPGANTRVFAPIWSLNVGEETKRKLDFTIKRDIEESRRELPHIVLASRLDPKKNHIGLVKAFAKSKELQSKSNLLISLRGIENAFIDYSNAKPDEIIIIDEMMEVIKENDLLGKVMFISINSQFELADTYRYMSKLKSVFSLTALYEPFGLAPIEAMCAGLPVAVTKYGGPAEVLEENGKEFGVLLDVLDIDDIVSGLLKLFSSYEYYQEQGSKRVISKYTWGATAKKYCDSIEKVLKNYKNIKVDIPAYFYSKSKHDLNKNFIKSKLNQEVT